MNIYLKNVNKKNTIVLLLITLLIGFSSCKSNEINEDSGNSEEEYFLSRPKFIVDTPVSHLPYTVKWEENRLVKSYEVQMAADQKFTDSRQNWTTKESFLKLSELKKETVYIRVRSHFEGESSRWSEILELKLLDDELQINRVRN